MKTKETKSTKNKFYAANKKLMSALYNSKLTLFSGKGVFLFCLNLLQLGLVKLRDLTDIWFVSHCFTSVFLRENECIRQKDKLQL